MYSGNVKYGQIGKYQGRTYQCKLTTDPVQYLPDRIGALILLQLSFKQRTSILRLLSFLYGMI
ncbi:unnamed protein product [Onchocerca flexuosa]|uniref:Transposase n=1 Tax=Onchocerca flexuosa TaxID=387005 RepID=A0A183HWP8_9BILA|nr:unnamed protein product [Onchocerca flexuosa]